MADNSVQVELSVDEQKAIKSLASVVRKFDELGTAAKDNIKKSDLAWGSFVGNLASTAVSKGLGLISSGISTLVGSIEGAVKASAEEATALQTLNVALAQTGVYTSKASKEFAAFAGEIETTTGIQTEAIFQTAAYIQQVNKLSTKELKQATQAAIDFSSALGIDLGSATTLVSKAIEGNTKALSKYGIEIQKGSTEAETLKNVLKALEGQQGAAEAKTKTFAGGFTLLETNIGNFQKSIGFLVAENPAVIAALGGISKGIAFLAETVDNNKAAITSFVTDGVLYLINGLKAVGGVLEFFNNQLADSAISRKEQEQSFFKIDLAITSMSLAINQAIIKTREFLGLDVSQALNNYVAIGQASISNSKEQIGAIDLEIQAIKKRTDVQNKAINDFASIVVDTTKNAIEQQKALTESGNQDFLMKLNERSRAAVTSQQETDTALALLSEANKAAKLEADAQDAIYKQVQLDTNFMLLESAFGREAALADIYRAQELQKAGKLEEAKQLLKDKTTQANAKSNASQIAANTEFANKANQIIGQTAALGTALAKDGSKEQFLIGKAASLAQIAVSTATGIANALLLPPLAQPPAIAFAKITGALSAATVAATAIKGYENGGFIGGNSFSGDRVVARVNSGEAVLNSSQQKNFMDIANGGGNGGIMDAIESLGNKIQNMTIVVQADGREIARLVRDQKLAGFVL